MVEVEKGGFTRYGATVADSRRSAGDNMDQRIENAIVAEDWDTLEGILSDLSFLETCVSRGQAFALVAVYGRAVEALPADRTQKPLFRVLLAALRRDIQFVARHAHDFPNALFQCLWNSCWWYDSPGAAPHFAERLDAWGSAGPPWTRPGPKLFTLMEGWLAWKERTTTNFCWVRSLLPPPFTLSARQGVVLHGHSSAVSCLALFPDARKCASGSWDNTVRVWDMTTGEELAVCQGHTESVTSLAVSSDGTRLLSGAEDGDARLWDAATGNCLAMKPAQYLVAKVGDGSRENPYAGGIDTHVAFVTDNCSVFSGDDKGLHVLGACALTDYETVDAVRGCVTGLCCSPDGTLVAVASHPSMLQVLDADECCEQWRWRCDKEKESITCIGFSPDSLLLAAGTISGTVVIWSARNGRQVAEFRNPEANYSATCDAYSVDSFVHALDFSPDGNLLAVSYGSCRIRMWHIDTGVIQETLNLPECTYSLLFSRYGTELICGGQDNVVRLLIQDPNMPDPSVGVPPRRSITSVQLSASGNLLFVLRFTSPPGLWWCGTGEVPVPLPAIDLTEPGQSQVIPCPGGVQIVVSVVECAKRRALRVVETTATVESAMIVPWDPRRMFDPEAARDIATHYIRTTNGEIAFRTDTPTHRVEALPQREETVFRNVATGEAVAWYPELLECICAPPSGRLWAGMAEREGSSLVLLRLQGE